MIPQLSQWNWIGRSTKVSTSAFGTRQFGHISSQRSSNSPTRVAYRNMRSTSRRSAPQLSASANGRTLISWSSLPSRIRCRNFATRPGGTGAVRRRVGGERLDGHAVARRPKLDAALHARHRARLELAAHRVAVLADPVEGELLPAHGDHPVGLGLHA